MFAKLLKLSIPDSLVNMLKYLSIKVLMQGEDQKANKCFRTDVAILWGAVLPHSQLKRSILTQEAVASNHKSRAPHVWNCLWDRNCYLIIVEKFRGCWRPEIINWLSKTGTWETGNVAKADVSKSGETLPRATFPVFVRFQQSTHHLDT